ncbi:YbaK/EbsC family protein [Streptomyces turgidiscabies]|uniref:Proline--tRNA ligase n=1 Tax=Streptomyces turgidiscabies (strain Car8) TaxID=698760 RepID=L7ESY4_STRT8|nr:MULTISPECIES: aminoacyl--tRNA ligase-related protein [Streptomyces]ELP61500.1 putative proline--tRNA ligase [Streptomyces turgidiscabies Car8]MDX3497285.1 YbaK/EbsC family protein [Streptomyces turgidiscabies]GAQ68618.1 proline--tRNA ligase [Streptomyces turgidiscabies]
MTPTTALYASRMWPPVRRGAGEATDATLDLLYHLGLVARTGATGVHTLLPLGLRVHDRMSAITRSAFERHGVLTFAAPTLQSRRLWEETGRWQAYQREGALLTVRSSSGEEMCLAPTSEEIATATIREHLRSFRDLPVRLSLSTSKFRDELSPRGGLMRGREFTMADAYTFDASADAMRESVDFLNDACTAALTGMGLSGVFRAAADGGAISAGPSTEHLVLSDAGQSTIVACDHCGNRGDGAVTPARPAPPPPAPVVNVIAFVLTHPDGDIQPAAVAVRSDLKVSARKVAATTGASRVALIEPQDLPGILGKEAGTLTPWDAADSPDDTLLLFDHSVADLDEFSISDGADGLRGGVTWNGDKDLRALKVSGRDLAEASDGSRCTVCPGTYRAVRAVEVAHVFELGTQYSQPMKLAFTDHTGRQAVPWMACSGIGITRCIQTAADLHRDHQGLRWKPGTGPADVHLAVLRSDQPEMQERTDRLVQDLTSRGLSLFVDDRLLSAGEKLRYARLLGLPHAAVLSPDRPAEEIEVISRWTGRISITQSSHIPQLATRG